MGDSIVPRPEPQSNRQRDNRSLAAQSLALGLLAFTLAVPTVAAADPESPGASIRSFFKGLSAGNRHRNPSYNAPVSKRPAYESDAFPYRYYYGGQRRWKQAKVEGGVFAAVDYAAVADWGRSGLFVAAVPLGSEPVDLDVLVETLMPAVGLFPSNAEGVVELRRGADPTIPGLESVDLEARRTTEGRKYVTRVRLIRSSDAAYLLFATTRDKSKSSADQVSGWLKGFQLTEATPTPEESCGAARRAEIASVLNELGLAEFGRGQHVRALCRLELAYGLAPDDERLVGNLVEIAARVEGAEAALARLDSDTCVSPELTCLRARLLCESERYAESIEAYAALREPLADDDLLMFAKAAVIEERFEEALEAFDRAIEFRQSVELRRWRATLLSRAGRHDKAIEQLTELMAGHPDNLKVVSNLAEAHGEAGQLEQGLRICRATLQTHPDSAELWCLTGDLELAADNYDAAKRSYERVLQFDPEHAEAAEKLSYAAALLGRGDNRRIRDSIDPVEPPAELAARLRSAPDTPAPGCQDHNGFVDLVRTYGYEFRRGKRVRFTARRRVLVLDRRGVKAMTMLSSSFDPLSERVYVNELVVSDSSGEEVARGDIEDYYVMDEASGLDTYHQTLKVPVPGIRVGSVVDLTITRESLSADADFGFEKQFLASKSPTRLSAVFVVGDVEALDVRAAGARQIANGPDALAWVAEDPTRLASESFQAAPESHLAYVAINDAGREWSRLGAEYLDDLAPTLARDEQVDRSAEQLCSGLESPSDKIEKLARYVQETLTYQGLEFGVRGVIPHRVGRIQHAGTGDCKDHTLLLHHYLRAVGVRSYLALINTDGAVEPGLPSTDQFDHMVLVVPQMPLRGGGVADFGVIDPTQKSLDPMLGAPRGLSERLVLVLDPQGAKLVRTPPLQQSHGLVICRRKAQVDSTSVYGAAALLVHETVEFGPYAAAPLRSALRDAGDDRCRELMQQIAGGAARVKIETVSVESLDDLASPLLIRSEYRVPTAFHEVPGRDALYLGTLPSHWAEFFCGPDSSELRRSPFRFKTPLRFHSQTVLLPPKGLRVITGRGGSVSEAATPVEWRSSAAPFGDHGLEINLTVNRSIGEYPASTYTPYQEATSKAMRLAGRAYTLEATTVRR